MANSEAALSDGIEPPATSLPEFLDQDRYSHRGGSRFRYDNELEGVFDSHDAFIFRETKGPDLGPRGRIAWSQVNWVRLAPLPSLSPGVRDARSPILARSIDGNVLYGSLTGPKGTARRCSASLGRPCAQARSGLTCFRLQASS